MDNQLQVFDLGAEALYIIVDNIFDYIELTDSRYQAVLCETLEELSLNKEQGEVIKPEKTREWLKNLAASALEE